MPGVALASGPGFYGKIPSRGDFVTRRFPRAAQVAWDDWLERALTSSREQLGAAWLPAYLESPLWRFALPAGLCGERSLMGVMMPSVDRVGRHFPFAIAATAPLRAEDPADDGGHWFGHVEALLLAALESPFDLDRYDAEVDALGAPAGGDAGAALLPIVSAPGVHIEPTPAIGRVLGAAEPRVSAWWTSGSDLIEPVLVLCAGMPPAAGFAAMLDGSWRRRGWCLPGEPGTGSDLPR